MRTRSQAIAPSIMEDFASYRFISSDEFFFDASDDCIYFDQSAIHSNRGIISLLHEIAHAELAHFDYRTDFELFAMESQAWAKTRSLARHYHIPCSSSFVQNCLASYSKWLESRSTCPTCANFSLQIDKTTYRCFSCQTRWRIAEEATSNIKRIRIQD